MKTKSSKPKPLFQESVKEYRLRAIVWILERSAAMQVEPLMDQFNKSFPGFRVSKETFTSHLNILLKRGVIQKTRGDSDARTVYWELA